MTKKEYYAEYDRKRKHLPERKRMRAIHYKTYRLKNKGKIIARSRVKEAIRKGLLVRMPCEQCGEKKSEAHHTDYRKPLLISWLCRPHHLIADKQK